MRRYGMAAVGEKAVADQFGLLLKAVAIEPPSLGETIGVTTKGVTHQRQIKAPMVLRLPNVGHFVNEQPLEREGSGGEIVAVEIAGGVEVNVAGWRHDDAFGLKQPPLAPDDVDARIIDRVAEHGTRQCDFAGGKGTGTFHGARS